MPSELRLPGRGESKSRSGRKPAARDAAIQGAPALRAGTPRRTTSSAASAYLPRSPRCGCAGGDEQRKPAGVPMPQAWGEWAAWAPKIRRAAFGPDLGLWLRDDRVDDRQRAVCRLDQDRDL